MRDPYFIQEVPQAQRHDFVSENPESSTRLAALKKDIRSSNGTVRDYKRPAQLVDYLYEDLKKQIDQKYPPVSHLKKKEFFI